MGPTTRFHVESPHELALLDQAARAADRRADVLLRVNLPGQEEQAALLHAHLASGVGADGLLAAAGRLVSFGRQWCAGHGVTEPEFNLGGGMAVDDQQWAWPPLRSTRTSGSVVVDRYRGRAGQP